jgi:signal transduction histidine kinase
MMPFRQTAPLGRTNPLLMTPEALVPRLGDYLVEKGRITTEDLQRALEYQEKLRHSEQPPVLGDILVDLGIISRRERDRAITELWIQFRSALTEANQQLEERVKERTADLEKALEQLSTLNELKANLVANISHELRTPLTHLNGYLDLLANGDFGALNHQQQNIVQIIQRSSERLGHLIEDLILFSVSEKDQIYLHIQATDLHELCAAVQKRNISKARDRQIEFNVRLPSERILVETDFEKISWVLMQLLDNAFKFTNTGGQVSLTATVDEGFVKLQVADTGIGIPPDQIEQVFEPFYQLDGSSTRKAGGTGLGLALARRIVEAQGSVIHVYSEVNKGSRFSFLLRIHQDG